MQKTILDAIVAQKTIEVQRLPVGTADPATLRQEIQACGLRRPFAEALRHPRSGILALIAEVKKASPSAGVICPDFDPVRIARQYEAAGAACLSVLTDEMFFQGSLEYLHAIRQAVQLPLLRKDFIIDARQILESIRWGADAILLIVAILDDRQLADFLALADAAGLTALVEVHDEDELKRALNAGAEIIGVNNRNLKTFQVDLQTTLRLAPTLFDHPQGRQKVLVAESGIHTRADVEQLRCGGVQAILVGESLVRHPNIAEKVRQLIGQSC